MVDMELHWTQEGLGPRSQLMTLYVTLVLDSRSSKLPGIPCQSKVCTYLRAMSPVSDADAGMYDRLRTPLLSCSSRTVALPAPPSPCREVEEETGLRIANPVFAYAVNSVFDATKHYVTVFMRADVAQVGPGPGTQGSRVPWHGLRAADAAWGTGV